MSQSWGTTSQVQKPLSSGACRRGRPTTYRRTKVVGTVGPACIELPVLKQLVAAGMDAVRINMSHSSHDEATTCIERIAELNRKARYPIPVMLDTRGPEVRTGPRKEAMQLREGEQVWLRRVGESGVETRDIEVEFGAFPELLGSGDLVKLDNGLINLRVDKETEGGVRCLVEHGGVLGSRKHVNFPGKHIDLAAIPPQDAEDVRFAIEHDVDFIAQSFVRTPDDILAMRELIGRRRDCIKVIAKIENHEGVAEAEAISHVADALMVARGDLGIETDIAAMPSLQRKLVQMAVGSGRRCIVATQMLESMLENPIPTRAEVVDVANAVYEGVDAVLLSGETSIGNYPVRAVEQVVQIVRESEKLPGLDLAGAELMNSEKQLLARSTVELAERVQASGIAVITRTGATAHLAANCAPKGPPIFAFTNSERTCRQLMLNRATYPHLIKFGSDPERTILNAMSVLVAKEGMNRNERVVVLSDILSIGGVAGIQVRTAVPAGLQNGTQHELGGNHDK